MDIIFLAETWEHEAKRIPKIDDYLTGIHMDRGYFVKREVVYS